MARIFTITEGVENLGAIKTGGQGSVYKGKRIGEIITAIKILPTPIYSENGDDKNFASFQNEVQKLRKVNEDANANVVTILHSGITESGNFPFIEMEYIEGPDLSELLKPPHGLVFTTVEALKVAVQLSNALAHCHQAGVKHGDIKSNNVKYNIKTGNYILLDFGLSVMSDEQRRTSLRHAGAVEFMAPEQYEGLLLYETEVYSFGVIMFELLSGTVPFPLKGNGETARNSVMVSHLEMPLPNLLSLRRKNMPAAWAKEKKLQELQVPEWLLEMIYKCLEKKPADRFADGVALQEFVVRNSILAAGNLAWGAERIAKLERENEQLTGEKNTLVEQLAEYQKLKLVTKQNTPGLLSGGFLPGITKSTARLRRIFLFFGTAALLTVAAIIFFNRQHTEKLKQKQQALAKTKGNIIPLTEEQDFNLKNARNMLLNGRMEEARGIYKSLARQDIPEALYQYGNLTLLNNEGNADCAEGMDYLKRAMRKGYLPAKRTAGLLYSFAADTMVLKQKGYQGCDFIFDIRQGAKLLMEATLQGDSTASLLLDELNRKYGLSE